jgi:hypothetical protein
MCIRSQSGPARQLSRTQALGLNVGNGARRISALQRKESFATDSYLAGQLRGFGVPVSRRSCGPASDPLLT